MPRKSTEVKPHPEALEKVSKVKIPKDEKYDFIKDTLRKVEADYTNKETRDVKLVRWYKKRYGIRPTSRNFPFIGASNTHIALTDEKIRKLKPNYLNLAFEGDPIVTMMPVGGTPMTVAQNAEIFMHWLLLFYMQQRRPSYFRSLALVVDRKLERGKAIAKVVWDYQEKYSTRVIDVNRLPLQVQEFIHNPLVTDEELKQVIIQNTSLNLLSDDDEKQLNKIIEDFKNGEQFLKFKEKTVLYDGPRVIPVDDKDFICPSYITDIQTSPRLVHILHYIPNDLKKEERSGKFENVDDVIDAHSQPGTRRDNIIKLTAMTTLEALKRTREGIEEYKTDTELIDIYEIYTYYDIDDDGIEEKVVIDVDPKTNTILRFIEFPYEHDKWPFCVDDYEYNDDRFYSQRGIPEILDHYQTILTNQENAKLDRMTLANSLQFKYRIGSVNMANMRFIPGQGIGVKRMDDLEELNIANLDISFDQEMMKIRGLAESYIGQPDLDIGAFQAPRERRTAFEVSEVVNLGRQVFSFDARLFKDFLMDLYDQIFELWIQYGADEVYVKVTGSEEPLKLTKADLIGNFIIVPNGQISLLSRTLEEQRAFALLELSAKDTSGAIDQYNAWENYLLKADPRASKRILRSRESFDQIQAMKMKQEQAEHEKKLEVAGRKTSMQLGQPQTGIMSGNLASAGGGRMI